jgi:nucleotide-binding universal stress UspA family protein
MTNVDILDHILVPLDGSRLAECVLPHAVALARAFGARVTLLRVVAQAHSTDQEQTIDPLRWHMRKTEAESYLDSVATHLREAEFHVDKVTLEGEAANNVIEFAHEHDVGLILLSSHGQSGLSEWNVSSVVQKIILRAYMPVMIVRAYQIPSNDLMGQRYKRVLVPLDGSQRAECVLPLASQLACSHDAQLLLAHAVRKPEVPRHMPLAEAETELVDRMIKYNRLEAKKYLADLKDRLECNVELYLLESEDTAAALHDLVQREGVDLVALSAHGYTSTSRWPYGSMALNFIAYGTTPLLVMQDMSSEELGQTQAEMATKESKGH